MLPKHGNRHEKQSIFIKEYLRDYFQRLQGLGITYITILGNYEAEQIEISQRYEELKSKVESEEKKTKSTNQFLETIRKYENVTELDRSMLCELIDTIYVLPSRGNRQGTETKSRNQLQISGRVSMWYCLTEMGERDEF